MFGVHQIVVVAVAAASVVAASPALAGTTSRVSVANDGAQANRLSDAPALSQDGRVVAFESDGALTPNDRNRLRDVYVHDRSGGAVRLASYGTSGYAARGASSHASLD